MKREHPLAAESVGVPVPRVTLAAHLARLITAELVSGTPAADLAPYRPGRFAAGPPERSGREPGH